MSQVLVRADSTAFYYALNHNRRRREVIASGCSTAEEISVEIADFQRRMHKPANFTSQKARTEALEACIVVRLAVAPGQDKRGGYVLLPDAFGGLLVGMHHVDPGHGDWMMRDALDHGATELYCWDIPALTEFYRRHGFGCADYHPNYAKLDGPGVCYMRKLP